MDFGLCFLLGLIFLILCWNWIVLFLLCCLLESLRQFLQCLLFGHRLGLVLLLLRRLVLVLCFWNLLERHRRFWVFRHMILWFLVFLNLFLCLRFLLLILLLGWFWIDRVGLLVLLGLFSVLVWNGLYSQVGLIFRCDVMVYF